MSFLPFQSREIEERGRAGSSGSETSSTWLMLGGAPVPVRLDPPVHAALAPPPLPPAPAPQLLPHTPRRLGPRSNSSPPARGGAPRRGIALAVAPRWTGPPTRGRGLMGAWHRAGSGRLFRACSRHRSAVVPSGAGCSRRLLGMVDAALELSPRMEAALELRARSLLALRRYREVVEMLRDYIPSGSLRPVRQDIQVRFGVHNPGDGVGGRVPAPGAREAPAPVPRGCHGCAGRRSPCRGCAPFHQDPQGTSWRAAAPVCRRLPRRPRRRVPGRAVLRTPSRTATARSLWTLPTFRRSVPAPTSSSPWARSPTASVTLTTSSSCTTPPYIIPYCAHRKVECYVRAIAQGVRTASIIDDRVLHSLLLEILTDEGTDRKRAAKAEEIHESRWH
ncbi:hypothetical protein BDA96_02G232500 [Sorghum bicolor]|uniref:Uncharacterized protein n=1 Tax=Sorghum bicolor TaxID=4558 RepID=A0A921UTT3_SORBI|nr:hypothetical protein BDA96_02G232500 [Sorghum bicolor]